MLQKWKYLASDSRIYGPLNYAFIVTVVMSMGKIGCSFKYFEPCISYITTGNSIRHSTDVGTYQPEAISKKLLVFPLVNYKGQDRYTRPYGDVVPR